MKSAHDFNVERLQGVTGRLNEVDTGVHAVVDDVHAVDFVLGIQVSVEALLDVLHNWLPRVVVVHKVAKARGVHDRQSQADAVLFNVRADALYADRLRCEVQGRLLALFRWVEGGVKESVDEGGLSEAGFT